MKHRIITLMFILILPLHSYSQLEGKGWQPGEFRQKLSEMYNRLEKSMKILRNQIVENQSAPFLPDLYLQLGELLVQKANVLYYIEKEKQQDISQSSALDKKFLPVVAAQKEAIVIFQKILKEFPDYNKRKKVLFLLVNALKSIDSIPLFIGFAGKLLKEFPGTKEYMATSLLLGTHHYDKGDHREALRRFIPVAKSEHIYEKNLARYRMGLVFTRLEKWQQALTMFVKVITDDNLKLEDNPLEVSLESKNARTNLKREALVDSIKPYTNFYKKNPKPVKYYSKIAPTELLFQEVIEKLAFRYIFLKKYNSAVALLRTLSERLSDPQRIINIYQEVLLQIPLKDRINIPVNEMKFVLEKFNLWFNFYDIPKQTKGLAYFYFEKQVRELGTRNHTFAKATKNPKLKEKHLQKAREFLQLYVGYFNRGKNSVKMAINLGDILYLQKDYLGSGDYYLRTFLGEFGKPIEREKLIQNAILSLTEDREYDFYEKIRVKGLLIKAIKSYMKFDKRKVKDPKLNFLLVKTVYEQGQYETALESLYKYMQKFKRTKYAVQAGNVILDYYNTRSDYAELARWSERLLNLKVPSRSFNKKLANIKTQALRKRLTQAVEATEGFDAFSAGKSYYKVAMATGNRQLMDLALKEALGKSKREGDYETFFNTARLMAKDEGSVKKQAELINSIVSENVRIGRYYSAINNLNQILGDSEFNAKFKKNAFNDAVNMALSLKDWGRLGNYLRSPLWSQLPNFTQDKVKQQMVDLLESPVRIPPGIPTAVIKGGLTAESMLALYKAQFRMPSGERQAVLSRVNQRCNARTPIAVCKWHQLPRVDRKTSAFLNRLKRTPPKLEAIEKISGELFAVTGSYKTLEGSGDPSLDMVLTLRNSQVYNGFAGFLRKVAGANAEFRQLLMPKVNEGLATSKQFKKTCRQILRKVKVASPVNRYCARGQNPTLQQAFTWRNLKTPRSSGTDPKSEVFIRIRRGIFVADKDPEKFLELATTYMNQGYLGHATAAALYGAEVYKGDAGGFNAVLGCSVLKMGLLNEARFHLGNASGGLKRRCMAQLNKQVRSL